MKIVFRPLIIIFLNVFISNFYLLHASECFDVDASSNTPPPYRYQSLPSELLNILQRSYTEHSPHNHYLDNSFWGSDPNDKCQWPKSLWKALDNIPLNAMYSLANVYQRAVNVHIWDVIFRIKNIWYGTSFGFNFQSPQMSFEELDNFFKRNNNFCRDVERISKTYHEGQICWREFTNGSDSGLHICFGKDGSTSIHVDYNNPAISRIPLTVTCLYNPLKVIDHYKDLKSPPPTTVFDIILEEKESILEWQKECRERCLSECINSFITPEQVLNNFDNDVLIPLSLKGLNVKIPAFELLKKINREKELLMKFSTCQ